jgi:glycosyltransferase involved in cell wall biosynthesis
MKCSRICILTETYYPVVGGGETQARAMAESLVDNGFAVIVITRRSHASYQKIERLGAITVYRIPPVGQASYKKWGLLLTSIWALIKTRRLYDLIFVSGFRIAGVSAVFISKFLGKSCILKADSRGEMSGEFFKDGLARLGLKPSSFPFRSFLWIRNRILKKANSFVAITAEIAAELAACGLNPDLIRSIPNSVDTSKFTPSGHDQKNKLRQEVGIPRQKTIITYTGRLVSYKGLPLLLRVWKQIQLNHENVNLYLVGSGGLDIHNCEAELKSYVQENKLDNSVYFTGDIQNVHEYLQASDIFVFPTVNDAFPISLIEAMACRLPVITTAVGGISDIVVHQQNGLLVDAENYQQLYNALNRLIFDDSLRAYLGKVALKTVHDRYSTETVIRQYIDLIKSILQITSSAPIFNI